MSYRVHNWRTFQHYKGRRPPWIKLHRDLLDNYEFMSLPLASRALAPLLWLLASESDDGSLPADMTKLAFRLRCSERELVPALQALEDHGFLETLAPCGQDASEALAPRKQDALPEKETEAEREAEAENTPPAPKGGALAEFTAAFNAAYDRDCKAPTLNRSQEQQLKRLVANHGPKGACCLPLLAWAYDQAKGGGERVRTRAVSHLLRDGERGTFVWATLLETAPAVARCGGVVTTERRLWRVAERLGLTEALEGFGCERPQEQSAAPDRPVPTLEEVRAMRRRAEEEARQRAIAKAEAEAAPLLAARTSA